MPQATFGGIAGSGEDNVAAVRDETFVFVEVSGTTMVAEYPEGQQTGLAQFLEEVDLSCC